MNGIIIITYIKKSDIGQFLNTLELVEFIFEIYMKIFYSALSV